MEGHVLDLGVALRCLCPGYLPIGCQSMPCSCWVTSLQRQQEGEGLSLVP